MPWAIRKKKSNFLEKKVPWIFREEKSWIFCEKNIELKKSWFFRKGYFQNKNGRISILKISSWKNYIFFEKKSQISKKKNLEFFENLEFKNPVFLKKI